LTFARRAFERRAPVPSRRNAPPKTAAVRLTFDRPDTIISSSIEQLLNLEPVGRFEQGDTE